MLSLGTKRPLIMGIINVTPDSFSGDGVMQRENFVEAAISRARQMIADGADILDIGGESSRPGSTGISVEEEIHRVVPVVAALRQQIASAVIAIDTVKAKVAQESLKAGATIINDISALRGDAQMASVVAQHKCPVVLMHNSSDPKKVSHDGKLGARYDAKTSGDIIASIRADLQRCIDNGLAAGISREQIILDPGIGFGKTTEQNLSILKHIPELKQLGHPLLIGASRKNFIGQVLDASVNDRLAGTASTTALAAFLGADIVRVHDVSFMADIATLAATVALSP